MSRTECLFQSFEGIGSVYVTTAQSLTTELLKQHNCKAFVLIYGDKKAKGEKQSLQKLDHITIKTKGTEESLGHLFLKTSNFIQQSKKHTSIMIWSPESWEMGAVFVFAHLIIKYGYSLDYIWKLNQRKIKSASISFNYVDQLQKLFRKELSLEEPKKLDQLQETTLGQRILRIRKNYSQLAKQSKEVSEIKKTEAELTVNPEKVERKSQPTSTSFDSQSFPSTNLKKKASDPHKSSKRQQVKKLEM